MTRQGSVILVVVMILAVLTTLGFSIMRSTTFLLDGAVAREQYAQRYYATESLMRYGIYLAKLYFDEFKKKEQEITLAMGAWPFETSSYKGSLIFASQEENIQIKALLEESNQTRCSISCVLTGNKTSLEVKNWHIGT